MGQGRVRLGRSRTVISTLLVWCVLLFWLSACTAELTPTLIPTPSNTELPTAHSPLTTPASVESPVSTPTPVATLTLSSNAEQELVTIRAAAGEAQGGYLFYLDAPGRTKNPQVLAVPRDGSFEAVVLAGNYGIKDHDFAVVCILDYIQVPCHDGASEKAFRFHLASNAETRLGVSLPLAPGTHDLVFLTFYDPDTHSTEQAFRQDTRFLYAFHRVQIIAGDATRPAPEIAQQIAGRFSEPADQQAGAGFFTLSRDKFTDPSQAPWHEQEISAGAPLQFFAAYSNPEAVTRTVALMAFLDFDQAPWDAAHPTFFAQLDAGARADVPARLSAPAAPGEHELVVVAIDNPYLDLAAQAGAGQPRSFFANSTDRVLLHVR